MAAFAALWAVPAQAVVDIQNGAFVGTITSGTASVSFFNAPTIFVDLTGMSMTFKIDADTVVGSTPYTFLDTGFAIPGSPNQYLRGFDTHGTTFPDFPITQSENTIHFLGAMSGHNNAAINLDLTGHLVGTALETINGNMKWTYHGNGNDFIDAKYDLNVDLKGYAFARGFVPEPATWALMILGLGFTGASLRRGFSLEKRNGGGLDRV